MPPASVLDTPLDSPPKRTRKVGSVADARRVLWRAVRAVDCLLTVPDVTPTLVLRASHALAQSAGVYLRLVEADELEARVAALERAAFGDDAKTGDGQAGVGGDGSAAT